jgi:uncharacterized delta-60 repeat protein
MMNRLFWMAALALTACGDDGNNTDDSSESTDSTDMTIDASSDDGDDIDAPVEPDAPPDAPPLPFEVPTPFGIPASPAGPDQMQSIAVDPENNFVIAGFAAQAAAGPRALVVVKTTPTGPVAGFGTDGVAVIPQVLFVGGNDEIDVAVQSTGHIIVTATVADETVTTDRDIAIVRLTPTGQLDPSFGTGGVLRLDPSTGITAAGTTTAPDTARNVAIGADDAIYVHGAKRNTSGDGTRTDTDFFVAKLSATCGAVTYGTGGVFTFDFNYLDAPGTPASVTARGIQVLADGSVIGSGYTATAPGMNMPVAPLLYKVTPAGALDESFAGGLYYETVLARQTEVYNFAIHGTNLVTAGYGRESGDNNKWISLRFNTATGARDTTWGGETNGAVVFDPSGGDVTNNARNAIALPNGKTLIIGSSGTGNPDQSAAFAVLDANGELDTAYGDGTHTLPLGANAVDQFWGAAASDTHIMIVGYSGYGATQTAELNDNSFGIVFPIR